MALERAATLYAQRGTTVDTGTGVDIKLLDDTQGSTDEAMSVRWGHTNDNAERTFAPSQGLYTAVLNANTLQKLGFALRLTDDMTPADDTNCNAFLVGGTATITLNLRLNMNGGTSNLGGTVNFTIRASLWRYNPSTDTGTSIANGSVGLSWNTGLGGDNNTYKDAVISIVVPSVDPNDANIPGIQFAQGEILLLQFGALSPTLPNPVAGTTNFDMNANTQFCKIDWAAGQGIRAACALSLSALGEGVATRGAYLLEMARSALGEGVVTYAKAANVNKTFSLLGEGVPAESRQVQAQRTFSLTGEGVATRVVAPALERTALGEAIVTGTKAVIASRTFTITGEGTPTRVLAVELARSALGEGVATESRTVQAFRTFSLIGEGSIPTTGPNGSSITVPIDELPTEGGGTTIVRRPTYLFDD